MAGGFPYLHRTLAEVGKSPRVRMDCRRPVPDDFSSIAPTMNLRTLMAHYRTGPDTLRRWLDETGVRAGPYRRVRPAPDDFTAVASTMSLRDLSRRYHTCVKVVIRWMAETGAEPYRGSRRDAKPMPADFVELAGVMVLTKLAAHYRITHKAILRWYRQAGVEQLRRPRVRIVKAKSARRIVRPAAYRAPTLPFATLRRDTSTEGRAADHLRKWAPVYRCNERGGVPDDKSLLTHWRYGNAVLTGAELAERAKAKGFVPEDWRRLAACHNSGGRPVGTGPLFMDQAVR